MKGVCVREEVTWKTEQMIHKILEQTEMSFISFTCGKGKLCKELWEEKQIWQAQIRRKMGEELWKGKQGGRKSFSWEKKELQLRGAIKDMKKRKP